MTVLVVLFYFLSENNVFCPSARGFYIKIAVAPRAGAWIETPFGSPLNTIVMVAPRAGAWIEKYYTDCANKTLFALTHNFYYVIMHILMHIQIRKKELKR